MPEPIRSTEAAEGPVHRTAAILAVGDEIALGQTLDTNSRSIADRLIAEGVRTLEHRTVDDDRARIAGAIARLVDLADLVVVTGGLGPTEDDLTREALGDVLAERNGAEAGEIVTDEAAMAEVREWFLGRGVEMPARNAEQGRRPRGARCLANPNGTAPGLHAVVRKQASMRGIEASGGGAEGGEGREAADVYCLPGPPREMAPMLERDVVGGLRRAAGETVRTRIIRTCGLGESWVAERLEAGGDMMRRGRVPLVGTTASKHVITCRLRVQGRMSVEEAEALLDADERRIRELLGPAVMGVAPAGDAPEEPIADHVVGLLRERGETLCVVESCTGGMLGSMVTSVAGSSAVFLGGWQTYANAMKTSLVGVPAELIAQHGAVSAEVARAMAEGGLTASRHAVGQGDPEASGATHCLAITGIAGPEGGSEAKPVGTVFVGLASRGWPTEVRHFRFRGGREAVRAWAARLALMVLRLRLIGAEMRLLGEVG